MTLVPKAEAFQKAHGSDAGLVCALGRPAQQQFTCTVPPSPSRSSGCPSMKRSGWPLVCEPARFSSPNSVLAYSSQKCPEVSNAVQGSSLRENVRPGESDDNGGDLGRLRDECLQNLSGPEANKTSGVFKWLKMAFQRSSVMIVRLCC